MSSKKLSPRQKMINMMYLVLTALLAMNVSKEVLNAFVVVGEGIEESNDLLNKRNIDFYEKLNAELIQQDSMHQTINQLIAETQLLTSESVNYIEHIRTNIKETSGIKENGKGEILFAKLDDLETGTRILTTESNNALSKGEQLRLKLQDIYNSYLDIIDKGNPTLKNTEDYIDYKANYAETLPLQPSKEYQVKENGETITWVNKNFYNVPVVASDVILSKIQNDLYRTETQILEYLKNQINADIPIFDQLSAAVIAPKSYLPAGKSFTADIFVAASSSKQKSEVFVGKLDVTRFNKDENGTLLPTHVVGEELFFKGNYKQVPLVKGKAKFEEVTSGVGQRNYEGIIRVKKPTGGFELYPFQFDYEVAPKAGFSIAPKALNVLYIGLDNPLSVTVSDSKETDIIIKTDNGEVKRKNGEWIANVSNTGVANIDVYGKIDGETKKIGTQKFRIKRVPKPVTTLDGIEYDGSITLAKLKSHRAIIPYLYDFVFDEVKFEVKSYDFIIRSKGNNVSRVSNIKDAYFSTQVKSLIANASSGDMVFFQNIMVKGPDGRKRKIAPIILKVN